MGWRAGRTVLVGRHDEQQQLTELCERAKAGDSGVLVVHGEAGIGKTALLADVLTKADGLRAIRVSGAESEMELAYAGVAQLCGPIACSHRPVTGPAEERTAGRAWSARR